MMPFSTGQLEGLHPTKWPPIHFNWDLSSDPQVGTIDQPTDLALLIGPPHVYDLRLGWVKLAELHRCLSPHSRQDHLEDFWERGCTFKFARLIAHLARGEPISPPFVTVTDQGALFLAGGHHRYAIASEVGVSELPIYVEAEHREAVARLINVRWIEG